MANCCGLKQEIGLKQGGDTHWGSHYGTIVKFILLYSLVINVLEIIKKMG